MGKKYIVEIGDNETLYKTMITNGGKPYIGIVNGKSYIAPDLEQIRKEAYDKGYDDATAEISSDEQAIAEKAYQHGLNDAWEAARKIASDNAGRNYSIFGQHFTVEILNTHSASECIEKIRQYEQEQEEQIQVGDEVDAPFGKATVTETKEKHVYYFYADGSYGFNEKEHVTKTGRHFPEIAAVLEKMRENNDNK